MGTSRRAPEPTAPTPLDFLARGALTLKGRIPGSSNATFLAEVVLDGTRGFAVYKPGRGERPLWDFPPGLFRREVAAFALSEALGWGIVPATILRDGPLGEGSLQQFVDADFDQHYFTLHEAPTHRERLQRIAVFDLIANNADRKAGHCLLGRDGGIYAIDNGLCFHVEPKLRTVIWDFRGEPVPEALLGDLQRLVTSGLPESLTALLAADERRMVIRRARAVAAARRFPSERGGWNYPWPLV